MSRRIDSAHDRSTVFPRQWVSRPSVSRPHLVGQRSSLPPPDPRVTGLRLACCISTLLFVLAPALAEPPISPKSKKPAPPRPAASQPAGKSDKSPGKTGKAPARPEKGKKNLALVTLKTIVENAEFDQMPFDDFIDWLGRTTPADLIVRWPVLEKAGVKRDRPITLKEKNLPVRQLLPLVFAQVTKDLDGVELAAKADGNILIITTRADLNSKLVVKSYAIQDLLAHAPNFAGHEANTDDIGQRGGGRQVAGGGNSGGGGGAVRPGSGGDAKESTVDERTRQVIDMITGAVEPDSWRVNGGKGTITAFKDKLVIRNTEEVHQILGQLLGESPADKTTDK